MATKSGLDAQLGVAKETTWGTEVVVSRFYEFNRETIKRDIARIASGGLRPGKLNRARSGAYVSHNKGAAGSIELETWNKGLGFWLEHMVGQVTTTQPDAVGNPTVFDHKGTFAGLAAKGFTCQVGRPDTETGTVRPFTYDGGKVMAWELKVGVSEIGLLTLDCDFQDEVTTTALAAATYASSPKLMGFQEAIVTFGGASFLVENITIRGNNNLKVDRYRTGGTKREPIEVGRAYTGQIQADFEDLTNYDRFRNATEGELIFKFEGGTITGAYKYTLQVKAQVRYDGETPNVEGPEDVRQPIPIVLLDDSIEILYRTTDATP